MAPRRTIPACAREGHKHRWFWITIGTALVVLGAMALFIPLVPTTPLLILAASCYAKSSERFHLWLVGSPLLGSYIRSYRDHVPLPLSTALATIALVWMAMLAMMLFIVNDPMVRLVLLGVAIAETILLPLWNRNRRSDA